MIPLTDADRATLAAPHVTIDFGCDVLDDTDTVIDTLSPTWTVDPDDPAARIVSGDSDLIGGTITHDSTQAVHRTCQLQITRELDWGSVWLRPWQSVTAAGHTVRVDLGVFRIVAPELPMGTEPLTWQVSGADRLSLLNSPNFIGDTRESPTGAAVADEIESALTDARVPGELIGLSTIADVTLSSTKVWMLDTGQPTSHLQRLNDLVEYAGCRDLFMDGEGRYRIEIAASAASTAAGWTFDVASESSITDVDRASRSDTWSPTNWWRFFVSDRTARPTEGTTQYTVDLTGGTRRVPKFVDVDAADYPTLKAAGDQQVADEIGRAQTVQFTVRGFPVVEHRDVYDYVDPQLRGGGVQHCVCQGWTLDLASGTNQITLELPNG